MKIFRNGAACRLCSAAFSLLVLLMFSSPSPASDQRLLWQSRDQFVALERQDIASGGPAHVNDHPAELALDRLSAILSSIDLRPTDGGKPEPLFTAPAVQALAPHLQQALHQASPGEDVTFAVIGLHSTLFGLAKSPKVTTGRVFYKDGRLNIIFGLVRQDVRDREDRRLFPFTPGSRHQAPEGEWTLLPHPGQNGFTLPRKDWVTFNEQWQAPAAQIPAAEQHAPAPQTAPGTPEKQLRETRGPAERLSTLNELKSKGLISDEEYRAKRLEILNGL